MSTTPTRVNKQALAALLVAKGTFPTKVAAITAIEAIIGTITEQVLAGNRISIPTFGAFIKFQRKNGKHKAKFIPYQDLRSAIV
jgi:nucleoid DNA-binding protein